jgi:hypothetical protein
MHEGEPATDSATRLRALAHPLRWKLLDLVNSEGSATATRCSHVLGESVASCSYHLGILGKYGYLELVPDTPGREKPWRQTTRVQDLSAPGPEIDEVLASQAATEAFLDHEWERTKARQRRKSLEPTEWAKATAVGGSTMWVTANELEEIKAELLAILYRYDERSDDSQTRPEGAREARVFFATSVHPPQ